MQAAVALEVSGVAEPLVRLPRTAARRGAITYCRIVCRVVPDAVWSGYRFEGELARPGSLFPTTRLPDPALLLECAGNLPGGWGHNRTPTVYILWRYDRKAGVWRELARAQALETDWTVALGPIAQAALNPPRPILVDTEATAARVMEQLEREIKPLEFRVRVLVLRAVEDRLAAGMAG